MLELAEPKGYKLDENGTDVYNDSGEHLVDLHNDCEIEGIELIEGKLFLRMIKNGNYNPSSQMQQGTEFSLVIPTSITKAPIIFSTNFEGIYDASDKELTLTVGENALTLPFDAAEGISLKY